MATDASGLRRMIWAKKTFTVVCAQWRAIANKTMEQWRLLHPQLGIALNGLTCNALELRKMRNDRDQSVDVWSPMWLPVQQESFKCGVKCCNKKVGDCLAICPRVGGAWARSFFGNVPPDIYGDSDYVYPASVAGEADFGLNCHKNTIRDALRSMQPHVWADGRPPQLYAWNRSDMTGYVCPAPLAEDLEHMRLGSWKVKGVSVACSKECYKILKLMTRDRSTDRWRAERGLQHLSREFWADGVYLCLRGVEIHLGELRPLQVPTTSNSTHDESDNLEAWPV